MIRKETNSQIGSSLASQNVKSKFGSYGRISVVVVLLITAAVFASATSAANWRSIFAAFAAGSLASENSAGRTNESGNPSDQPVSEIFGPFVESCSQTRHEYIKTGSQHYLPGETVVVAGNGFAPQCEVLMAVNFPDGTVASGTATTDGSGNLSYSYVLGGGIGDYSVQAERTDGSISLAMAQFASGIFIMTDKMDYKPGETVTFSGRGFAANETISLLVRQSYPGGAPDRSFSAVADGSGSFRNSSLVVGAPDLNTTLSVSAVGLTSGLSASAIFTDAQANFVAKVVNTTPSGSPFTGTTLTAAYPGGTPTAGNFLVAVVSAFGGTTIGAPLPVTGWLTAVNETGISPLPSQAIFYKYNSAGVADNSVTVSFSPASTGTISIYEYENVLASSNPFDGSNLTAGGSGTSTGAGTTVSSGTVAPTALTDLLVSGLTAAPGAAANVTFSAGATNGFARESPLPQVNAPGTTTQRVNTQSVVKKTSPAGANSTSMTIGTSTSWRGQVAAFKTKADTTTTLASSNNPSVVSQPVTFTATVSPNTATGTVTFTQTSPPATLCTNVPLTLVLGQMQATCTTTYNAADSSIPVTATYSGDGAHVSSANTPLTQVVNKANTTASTPTSSYNPAPFQHSVTFSTTVTINSPGTGSIPDGAGNVTFRNGGLAGSPIITGCGTVELVGSVATCTTVLAPGTHSITAEFNNDSDFNDSPLSGSLSQVVNSAPTAGGGCNLVVNQLGANTGAYLTIQEAVNGLPNPGPCTITVLAGTYNESVDIDGSPANNNNSAATLEAHRIIIRADPAAAPGSVIVTPAGLSGLAAHHGFTMTNAKFITLKGFNITGAERQAILLSGGGNTNQDIVIDSNFVHDNGSPAVAGGIGIGGTNTRTWIVNNLVYNNGRDGLAFGVLGSSVTNTPKYVINNTFYGNGWNGLNCPADEQLYAVNNLFVGNGTEGGGTGGRFGMQGTSTAQPLTKFLKNNMFYKNTGGDIGTPAFWFEPASTTDSGNRTTVGTEGAPGVAGCTFTDCANTHTFDEIFVSTALNDFHLRTASTISPAIDRGINSTTAFTGAPERVPSLDFEGNARPTDGNADATATVDVGYDETPGVVSNGTLTVNKVVVPGTDTGLFNLQIDGATAGTGANQGNGGTTGAVTVTPGSHTVSEIAGTATTLSDYTAVINGDCLPDGTVSVGAGEAKTCTITNTKKPKLTVTKVVVGDTVGRFNLLINSTEYATNVGNGGTTNAQFGTIGSNTFGETGGTSPATSLTDYTTVISGTGCTDNGNGTGSITLAAGDNLSCTITNTKKPKLTVTKVVVGDTVGRFNLLINSTEYATNVGNGGTTNAQFGTIGSNTFGETGGTIPATSLADYTTVISGTGCTDNGNGTGSITLAAGDNLTCTITNTKKPKLTVTKVVVGDTVGRFNLLINSTEHATNVGNGGTTNAQFGTIGSNTFGETGGTIPATSLADYTTVISGTGCTDNGNGTGSITLAAGDDLTCTITNTKKPKLTVIKHVVNDHGGLAGAGAWTLAVSSNNGGTGTGSAAGAESPGTLYTLESGKQYNVSESGGPSGYAESQSTDCTISSAAAGANYVCTITNNDIQPTITVTKVLNPASDPGRFNLRIDGTSYADNVGNGGTTGAVGVMANSAHIVDETGGTIPVTSLANYTRSINCGAGPVAGSSTSINLLPGQNATCVITNNIIDADADGIPDFLDCTPSLYTDRVVDPAGTLAAYLPAGRRHSTLQAAVIAAADDDVIAMIANTTENVIIGNTTASGGKDMRIVGCGKKITGAVLTKPVITAEVSAGANDGNTGEGEADIHIDDLDVTKGSIGYLIETSKVLAGNNTSTLLKSIRSDSNTGGGLGIGIKIQGNGNEVRGSNSVGSNSPGDGIQVIGNNNILRSNRVLLNKGDGIDVTGNSNSIESNPIGDKSKGNKANGIIVNGASNNVEENDVYASTLLGIKVTGNLNNVAKNDVGDQDKGNLGGGILITGNGTNIKENSIFANTGIGLQVNGDTNVMLKNDVGDRGKGNTLDGIKVVGSGNSLTENNSYANGFNSNGTANGGDGFDISGGTAASPNILVKNSSGAGNAGNGGHGFLLAGLGNGIALPIELDENTSKGNKLNGFKITGTGWQLAKNVSGGSGSDDNVKWEFEFVLGNFNATGNKANGATLLGLLNSAFLAGGLGTP